MIGMRDVNGFTRLRGQQVVRQFLLLVAVAVSSALVAAAQGNHSGTMTEHKPNLQSFRQGVVSTNELQAPHDAQIAVQRAREALEHQHYSEAKRQIALALEVYPSFALALQLRGNLSLREKHLEEARSDFQQAIEYDPNFGTAYLSLGAVCNRLGHFQEAVVPLTRAAAMLPTAWAVHYEMALAYWGSGKYDAALGAISRAVDKNPAEAGNRSSIFYTKARVLLDLNEAQAAKAAFEQSIQQDPKGHFAQLSHERLEQLSAMSREK